MMLIPFITAGFPTKEAFAGILKELDSNGADIIEIGVPFSDPVADGPVIEAASIQALANGVTLPWIFEELRKLKGQLRAKLVLMGYLNPFLQYGPRAFADTCAELGIYGVIIPDLPLDESAEMRALLKAKQVCLISLVAPNTPEERMRAYAEVSEGYVYVVSVLGVTGARSGFPPEAQETLRRARKVFKIPLALGFGFSHPDQLKELPELPDGIIFGSALVRHLGEGKSAGEFMRRWKV